jgi:hypothetical protein
MLNLFEDPDQPDGHSDQSDLDNYPEVEIIHDTDKTTLPASIDQIIIGNILNTPDSLKMPDIKKSDTGRTLN